MSQPHTSPGHQITPVRNYVLVFLALIALTIATTLISRIDLGEFNFVVALTIAIIKASLVVWFFMHMNHTSSMTRLMAFAGLFWLAIMLVFVMSDYVGRGLVPGVHWR